MIFRLEPKGKDYIWGGERLKTDYGKNIDLSPLAETWECSVHPDGESIVSDGEFSGRTLRSVLSEFPQYCGTNNPNGLPLLVKLIDASDNLSVQVHPDDKYAELYENQKGKTEMWYVLDADENASLIYGFKKNFPKEEIENALTDGSILDKLNKIPVKKGDVFFIPSGTVHAIGKGVLVAEIQQNSNLTYRIYDYERKDRDGNLRPLHIGKALDVMNICPAPDCGSEKNLRICDGCSLETLCKCEYFTVEKALIKNNFRLGTDIKSFKIILFTDGEGVISENNNNKINFRKGDCLFVSACSDTVSISGKSEALIISA